MNNSVGVPGLNRNDLNKIPIPVPIISTQQLIVNELDSYQKVIEGCNVILENYSHKFEIDFGSNSIIEVGDCCQIFSGGTPSTKDPSFWEGHIPFVTSADIENIFTFRPRRFLTEKGVKASAVNLLPANNVLVVTRVGLGKVAYASYEVAYSQDCLGLVLKDDRILPKYLCLVISQYADHIKSIGTGVTIQGITISDISQLKIPIVPIEKQSEIISIIEDEYKTIEGCKNLKLRMENKIKAIVNGLWNKA